MSPPMPEDINRLLESLAPPIRELAQRTCDTVRSILRPVLADPVVTADQGNIGFGTGTGYKATIFVVSPQRAYVNLGIAHGPMLPDTSGLLEGTGKVHRHVKIRQAADLERPELRQLMAAAAPRALHNAG